MASAPTATAATRGRQAGGLTDTAMSIAVAMPATCPLGNVFSTLTQDPGSRSGRGSTAFSVHAATSATGTLRSVDAAATTPLRAPATIAVAIRVATTTTGVAVRITHEPTGLVVAMQDEKSQTQNRERAMVVLRSRLLALRRAEQDAETAGAKRAQGGGGGRSEKIRTYNYKDNRVTDHRIGLTLYSLDKVLAGELDLVSDPLLSEERARLLTSET